VSWDDAEFQELYQRYGPAVFARCITLTGRREEAEEALQETFYRVWKARSRVDRERSPLGYLYTVARNESINQLRARKPWRDDPLAWLNLADPSTVDPVACRTVSRLLDRISPRDAALLRLRHVEENTIEELALMMGTSQRSVRRRLERLMKRTRAILAVEAA
jgi:RNA polymerase sigma-70 factor (ECF subfamily)